MSIIVVAIIIGQISILFMHMFKINVIIEVLVLIHIANVKTTNIVPQSGWVLLIMISSTRSWHHHQRACSLWCACIAAHINICIITVAIVVRTVIALSRTHEGLVKDAGSQWLLLLLVLRVRVVIICSSEYRAVCCCRWCRCIVLILTAWWRLLIGVELGCYDLLMNGIWVNSCAWGVGCCMEWLWGQLLL